MAPVVPVATVHRALRVPRVFLFLPLQLVRPVPMVPQVPQLLQRGRQQSLAPMAPMELPGRMVSLELLVPREAIPLLCPGKAQQVWMVLRHLQHLRLLRLLQMRPKVLLGLMASMRWAPRLPVRMALTDWMVQTVPDLVALVRMAKTERSMRKGEPRVSRAVMPRMV